MDGLLDTARACAVDVAGDYDLAETASLLLIFGPVWLLVALFLVPVLLFFYVRSIDGYMKVGASAHVQRIQSLLNNEPPAHTNIDVTDSADIIQGIEQRFRFSRRKLLIIAFGYLATLFTLSIVWDSATTETLTMASAGEAFLICALLSLPVYFLVNDSHRPAVLIGCVLIFAVVVYLIVGVYTGPSNELTEEHIELIVLFVFAAIYYCSLCVRKYRRLVPYFTIVLTLAPLCVLGFLLALSGAGCMIGNFHDDEIFIFILLLCAVCAWLFFMWLGLLLFSVAYSRHRISEQQLSACCWIIVTGLITAFLMQVDDEDSVMMVGYAIGIPPAMVLALFFYLELSRAPPLTDAPQSLLYLRVFRSSAQSLRLFRSIAQPWRSVGPVNMIAGPDLAKLAVEPDEIFHYLCGNLKKQFIRTPENLEEAFAKPLHMPDPDGRYRVNEFFCFDGIWQDVAERLIVESDNVLIDLREFSLSNFGAAKEIGLLADTSSLNKVLFVVENQEKQSDVVGLIETLTGYRIGLDQVVCVDVDGSHNLMAQLLELRRKYFEKQYNYNEALKTLDPYDKSTLLSAKHDRQQLQQHKLLKQHRETQYKFSFLYFVFGIGCMLFGSMGIQLLPAVYLKLRGVSWGRFLRVIGLIVALVFFLTGLDILFEAGNDAGRSANSIFMYAIALMGVYVSAQIIVWALISKKINRWIAEGKNPLKAAIKQAGVGSV